MNRPMRKKEREVTDTAAINAIIEEMDAIRVGLYDKDEDEIYIVPLSFGYKEEQSKYTFYMHGAKTGRKADLIKADGKAGFELDKAVEVKTDPEPCDHTVMYNSIIGHGAIGEVTDPDEKIAGLNAIMKQNTGKGDWNFPEKVVDATLVIKLSADWLTCKVHE